MELLYLLLVNTALNLQLTKNIINKLKPAAFQITWTKAWTPYPFKIYIEEGSAWGISSSQKWKVAVKKATAKIDLLPFLYHQVRVYDIDVENIDYSQQSVKSKSEKTNHEPYVASLTDSRMKQRTSYTTANKKTKQKKEEKSWNIALDNITAQGEHSFWIYQAKGVFSGGIHIGSLNIKTNGGLFSVNNGRINILMNTLQIGKKKDVLTLSKLKGRIDLSPIVFSENTGTHMLSFLTVNSTISSQVGHLEMMNVFLKRLNATSVEGKGRMEGHIVFDKGLLRPETNITIFANPLALSVEAYSVKGEGEIGIIISKEEPSRTDAYVHFDKMKTTILEKGKETVLFRGKALVLEAKGSPRLVPTPPKKEILTSLALDIPAVTVENIALMQRYVPEKWAFTLKKGVGELYVKARVDKRNALLDAQLLANSAKVGLSKHIFQTDLDLKVKLNTRTEQIAAGQKLTTDISGSHISLQHSVMENSKQKSDKWDTFLSIDKGVLTMPLPGETNTTVIKPPDIKKIFGAADALMKVSGNISRFDWLNMILTNSLNLNISGKGEIVADLKLKKGQLLKGSSIHIVPHALQVGLLDYSFSGNGQMHFNVTEGGNAPSMVFNITLHDAKMKRRSERETMIEHVEAILNGNISDLDLEKKQKEIALHLKIPSAKVKNIAIYNGYIPKNSPFKLTGGTANLTADINLKSNDARGYVQLSTHGLAMNIDKQNISARLRMDLRISGGVPRNMLFNISGSTITIDQARVQGSTINYRQSGWYAKIGLKKANVVWRKPMRLHSKIALQIKDSRPIVAMLDNQKEKHNWLSKLMTIQDIKGNATVNMANNVISVPYAFVKSDKIDIGAKGLISSVLREGMFYLRYKKLKILLKLRNGKKNIDIFHVKKTFDSYHIPKM